MNRSPDSASVSDDLNIASRHGHFDDFVLIVDPEDPLGGVSFTALVVEPGERLRAVGFKLDLVEFALAAFHHYLVLPKQLKSGIAGDVLARDEDHKLPGAAEQGIILATA